MLTRMKPIIAGVIAAMTTVEEEAKKKKQGKRDCERKCLIVPIILFAQVRERKKNIRGSQELGKHLDF